MSSFLGGSITGSLIGVVVTLLVLMIVAGVKGPGNTAEGQVPNRKVFLGAFWPSAGFVTHSIWRKALCLHSCSQFC